MNTSQQLADRFLTIYNIIDKEMRRLLAVDDNVNHAKLIADLVKLSPLFEEYEQDLRLFAKLRNAIVHNPYKSDADPIAEPHESAVDRYSDIKNIILNPPKALGTIAIPSSKIYSINLDENAFDVMEKMNSNVFTHVPVYDEKRLVGIFSENTLFSYVVTLSKVSWDKSLMIRDFSDILSLNYPKSECFIFAHKDSTIFDIKKIFKEYFCQNKRVAVVFITENGKADEDILGMITAWDIAAREKDKNYYNIKKGAL